MMTIPATPVPCRISGTYAVASFHVTAVAAVAIPSVNTRMIG